jgi:hypothetical protein
MAKENWYQTNQMKLFAVRMSPEMIRRIGEEAVERDLPKKDLCRAILVAFLPQAETATYVASYKSDDAQTMRFWMDRDIYDAIVGIAKKKNVSLTSACYTAFYHHFQKQTAGTAL